LLDEIEKAHPEIFNIFLSVFDDGRLTDNTGRNIDCSNAIFILTSNLGAQEFLRSESVQDLRGLASRFLRPELVNRISEVIAFAPLGKRTLARILDVIITEKADDFQRNHQLQIIVENDAKATILSESCEPNQGARQLERAVEFLLVHPLVDALFSRQIEPGTTVFVRSEDNKLVFQSKGT
jgi:ATP-dependent Clp protease ATP-binding subunit ClpA